MSDPSLLLLIPAYNEEDRIEPVLREYARFFQENYKGKFQFTVILNGCRDNTLGVVQRVEKDFSSVTHREFADPIGKGGALIEGLYAVGETSYTGLHPIGPDEFLLCYDRLGNGWVVVRRPTHSDIAHSIGTSRETVSRLINEFEEGFGLVNKGKFTYIRENLLE